MPRDQWEWGTVQISGYECTSFRFEMQDGKPLLDFHYFADLENGEGQWRECTYPGMEPYGIVQQLLKEYVEENKYETICFYCHNERGNQVFLNQRINDAEKHCYECGGHWHTVDKNCPKCNYSFTQRIGCCCLKE